MRRGFELVIGIALAFGFSPQAYAQHRGPRMMTNGAPVRPGFSTLSMARAHPGVRVIRLSSQTVRSTFVPASTVAANTTTNGVTVFSGFAPITLQQLLNPVPGLGFDFPHLAAVNHNLDVRALIDPVTQGRLALAEQLQEFAPAVPVGFPFFAPATPVVVVEQPPPVVVLQQAAPTEQAPAATPVQTEAKAESVASQPPLPEAGEFVLVRRDGSIVFAVAFERQGDRLVYITSEGVRRSMALADLDVNATRHMNEDRGTTLQLPL